MLDRPATGQILLTMHSGPFLVASLVLMLGAGLVLGQTVSNVRASQQPSGEVRVVYDLGGTSPLYSRLEASLDGGTNWTVPVNSLSGNGIAVPVSAGLGKVIVWNAMADWPGQITSRMQFRVSVNGPVIPLITSEWQYYWGAYGQGDALPYPAAPGVFELTSDGLRFYDYGYRGGSRIESLRQFSFSDKRLKVKWRVFGGTNTWEWGYLSISFSGLAGFNAITWLSVNHSYAGSLVIPNNTWHYTSVVIDEQLRFTAKTATGDYAENRGSVIQTRTGAFADIGTDVGRIGIEFGDTYAPTVYVDVAEVSISELDL